MKKFFSYSIIYLLFFFMMTGCAQWGGDNPVGITGGGEDGYGQDNNLNTFNPERVNDPDLIGTWYAYQGQFVIAMITFNDDETFHIEGDFRLISNQSNYGTYSASGINITLNMEGESYTGAYFITEDRLTITIDRESMTFYQAILMINYYSQIATSACG